MHASRGAGRGGGDADEIERACTRGAVHTGAGVLKTNEEPATFIHTKDENTTEVKIGPKTWLLGFTL